MEQGQLPAGILGDLDELKKSPPNLGKKQRASARNGQLTDSASGDSGAESSSSQSVAFNIGDEVIRVPEMTWAIIEEVMPMLEAPNDPTAKWYHTKVRDFEIFLTAVAATRPDLTLDYVKSKLTLRQANELSTKLLDLLRLSGFEIPTADEAIATMGESEATKATSSTETLTVSSHDLSEEGAQELLSGNKSSE